MKLQRIFYNIPSHGLLLSLVLIFSLNSCREEVELNNQSTSTTIPLGSGEVVVRSSMVDKTGQFLYINCTENGVGGGVILKKINLSNLTVSGEFATSSFRSIGNGELVLTGDNHLMISSKHQGDVCTIESFDSDLNHLKSDTFDVGPLPSYTGVLLKRHSADRLDLVFNTSIPYRFTFTRWIHMDNSLNQQYVLSDTSSEYLEATVCGDMINTSDGGTLFHGIKFIGPYLDGEILLEKRDANFNLEWRTIYAPPGEDRVSNMLEVNGKYYIYASGMDPQNGFEPTLYVLVYDLNGNLLENKRIESLGINQAFSANMVATEDGGFLLTGATSSGNSITARTGILYKTDANLNVIGTTLYGGTKATASSRLLKISNNRYLLIYTDNSFEPSGNDYRIVLRYIDSNGEFIK